MRKFLLHLLALYGNTILEYRAFDNFMFAPMTNDWALPLGDICRRRLKKHRCETLYLAG